MGTPGARVVLANGKFAVLANGKFAVYNAAGECPECCGGATGNCTDWQATCFDGTALPLVSTYTPCELPGDCAGKDGYSGTMPWEEESAWYFGYDIPSDLEYKLWCVDGVWNFQVNENGKNPPNGCWGTATPALVCAGGVYPTGTFNVTIYNGATACGVMTVTLGP